jgi:F0F1-type ATP synthase membrane subunit a
LNQKTLEGNRMRRFAVKGFTLLELLVGFIQALVFAMLVLVYLSIATTKLETAH